VASAWGTSWGSAWGSSWGALVSNLPPVADFTFGVLGLAVTFSDASTDTDGTIVSWLWDFGDSTTSSSQNPVKVYLGGGSYTVRLTVTDDDGATHFVEKVVDVAYLPPSAKDNCGKRRRRWS
jgi:PKD repeat protein